MKSSRIADVEQTRKWNKHSFENVAKFWFEEQKKKVKIYNQKELNGKWNNEILSICQNR